VFLIGKTITITLFLCSANYYIENIQLLIFLGLLKTLSICAYCFSDQSPNIGLESSDRMHNISLSQIVWQPRERALKTSLLLNVA